VTRKTIIGILALPVLVVLFLAMSWIDGALVRARLARLDSSLSGHVPFILVTSRKETGGLFNSTVEVNYEFSGKLFKGMAAATAKQTVYVAASTTGTAASTPNITLRYHIQHGPAPGFAALGLARVDTEIVIPEDDRQELRKSIGTDQPLKIITLLGYFGGGTTSIDSPAFIYNDKKTATRVDWKGIKGVLHFSRHLNSQDGNIALPGMNVQDDKGVEVVLGPIRFDYDMQRAFKSLFVGKATLRMERMAVSMRQQQPGPGSMEMRDLVYDVTTTPNGDYLDTVAKIGLGSMSVATLKSASVHYDFSLRHMHGPTYAELAEKLRSVYAATFAGDDKAAQQIVASLKQYGALLLEHQPELTIDRVSMSLPEGSAQLSGKVSIPGYAHGDLDSGATVLLPKIDVSADIAVDEGLLNRDWGPGTPPAVAPTARTPTPPSRIEAMKAQLAALEQQGFVTRKGSRLSSHIEFKHGALTVNGKPMGPPPGASR
jgi:uncharacterized protein YdgA (DUF945 family)